ncbi:MAG TPA: hypothetical protein VGK00_11520 [Anaerolineales bacterium]|jgi:hypothetical protein
MKNNLLGEIQKQFSDALERASLGYFELGFNSFLAEQKKATYAGNQAIIGNLAIAVELMLKAFIAKKNLLLVFKNLPSEIRVLITNPESIPDNFNWRSFEIELRSASYPTIELDECISLFYLFYPEKKQTLQSHLKYLSRVRNASVHSVLPVFQQQYEVKRVTYTALKVSTAFLPELFFVGSVGNSPESASFLLAFQENLVEKVHKVIENAKEKAKRLPAKGQKARQVSIKYWEQAVIRCPICGNLAICDGSTERMTWSRRENEDINQPGLWFEPENFNCSECGLSLDGYDEMTLAGIDLEMSEFDRTEELDEFENNKYYSVTYFDE